MSEPRRDAVGGGKTCDYCGGQARSTLDGEHIWKCSEVVPREALEELLSRWQRSHEFATTHRDICSDGAIHVAESHINELQEVLEKYE